MELSRPAPSALPGDADGWTRTAPSGPATRAPRRTGRCTERLPSVCRSTAGSACLYLWSLGVNARLLADSLGSIAHKKTRAAFDRPL
eukprot:4521345-Pleurochrysis_carterae.AAC.1